MGEDVPRRSRLHRLELASRGTLRPRIFATARTVAREPAFLSDDKCDPALHASGLCFPDRLLPLALYQAAVPRDFPSRHEKYMVDVVKGNIYTLEMFLPEAEMHFPDGRRLGSALDIAGWGGLLAWIRSQR